MKKIFDKMRKLNLSVKKEMTIFGCVIFLFLAATFVSIILLKNPVFLAFGVGICIVFSIFFFSRYGLKIDKIDYENLLEFSELFSFFRVYIKNGYNVYNALKEITNFANDNLKELLTKLLDEIDNDKSVQPFIDFSHNFNEIVVEEMMISIYQMIDDGEQSNYLVQFEYIFDKFSDNLKEQQLRKKDSKLATICSSPLVGSCFLIIVITIGVIGILGELVNGI